MSYKQKYKQLGKVNAVCIHGASAVKSTQSGRTVPRYA